MDERVKGEYRKIYTELMMWIMIFLAASLIIKFTFLGMGAKECMTEFMILVLSPLYIAVRQYMMGLNPNENVSKKKERKALAVAILTTTVVFIIVSFVRNDKLESVALLNIAVFAVIFTAVFYVARRLAKYFSDRKAKKYEE